MPTNKEYSNMIFDLKTTQRTEFQGYPYIPKDEKKDSNAFRKELNELLVKCAKIDAFEPLKNVHTMSECKDKITLPFNLFHKTTPIVKIDPRVPQPPFERSRDVLRREVQRTRPRLVMTPAVSMDDIEENDTRDVLIKNIYTSTMQAMQNQVKLDYLSVKAPLGEKYARADVLAPDKICVTPYVDPAFRQDMLMWDESQLRLYGINDKQFWLDVPTTCTACEWGRGLQDQNQNQTESKLT